MISHYISPPHTDFAPVKKSSFRKGCAPFPAMRVCMHIAPPSSLVSPPEATAGIRGLVCVCVCNARMFEVCVRRCVLYVYYYILRGRRTISTTDLHPQRPCQRVLGPTCTGLLTGKDPTSAREVVQLSNFTPCRRTHCCRGGIRCPLEVLRALSEVSVRAVACLYCLERVYCCDLRQRLTDAMSAQPADVI